MAPGRETLLQRTHASRAVSAPTVLAMFFFMSLAAGEPASGNLEETVCGWLAERAAFAAWSWSAGRANPAAWRSVPGATPVSHKTRDGRVLRGYKISRSDAGPPRDGFLLVAQGNAMLADQLLHDLSFLADRGKDVFVYDYRGYGNSDGKRRLKAIVSDYRELFNTLGTNPDDQRLLYGISFGGIVLLNVIGSGAKFDRAVIDSSPSRISQLGCPPVYDPVGNLPTDSSNLMVVSGQKDTVVPPSEMAELLSTAKSRGAQTVVSDDLAHAFMDEEQSVHQERQKLIKEFLFRSGRWAER
jgi:alpha-beta hydrolase superfamily lysophospholipase